MKSNMKEVELLAKTVVTETRRTTVERTLELLPDTLRALLHAHIPDLPADAQLLIQPQYRLESYEHVDAFGGDVAVRLVWTTVDQSEVTTEGLPTAEPALR